MIKAKINGQDLVIDQSIIAAGTISYLEMSCTFNDEWKQLIKTAHFQNLDEDIVFDFILKNDKISSEDQLNLSEGTWEVWIHGNEYIDNNMVMRITTNIAKLKVKPTGLLNGEPLPINPPSLGEQILGVANEAKRIAEEAKEMVETDSDVNIVQGLGDDEKAVISQKASTQIYRNLFSTSLKPNRVATWSPGMVNTDGTSDENYYFFHSNFIPVYTNETIIFKHAKNGESYEPFDAYIIAAYNKNKENLPEFGAMNVSNYEVLSNIAYIVVTIGYTEAPAMGYDVLISAEYEKLSEKSIPYVFKNCANALRGQLFGASVSADDVSPIEHELDISVSGKNFFKTTGGTVGSLITTDGSTSNITYIATSDYIALSSGRYFISYDTGIHVRNICFYDLNRVYTTRSLWTVRQNGYSFQVTENCFVRIDFERADAAALAPDGERDAAQVLFEDYHIQLEKGEKVTDYTPYFDVNGITVYLFGKNLSKINQARLPDISEENPPIVYEGYLPNGALLSWSVDFTPTSNTLYKIIDTVTNDVTTISANVSGNMASISPQTNKVRIEVARNASGVVSDIQLELGNTKTEFELYKEPVDVKVNADGNVTGLMSLSPNMTLTTDNAGAVIECTYNRDTNKVIENLTNAIISLGGNI